MNIKGKCDGIFAKSMVDLGILCAKYGIEFRVYYLFNESLIQRARNYVADEFIRSDFTHLMFIDSDIGFNANDVITMLAISTQYGGEENSTYDVITSVYPKKSIAWEKVYEAARKSSVKNPFELEKFTADFVFNPAERNQDTFQLNEPLEVSEAGTGFMLIPRYVFDKYKETYPEYSYKPDHVRTDSFDGSREIMAYFHVDFDQNRRLLSEDYFFCRKVRDAGMKVHICPWVDLNHVGSYIFKGSMVSLAQSQQALTASNKSNPKNWKKQR